MPPFGGALPPTLSPAPPGAGPAVAPHGNPGNATSGLQDVKAAVEALQKALPSIPMGSELHTAVWDSIGKISKHMANQQDDQQQKLAGLLQLVQRLRAQAPNQNLAGAMGGQPGGPAPPNLGGAAPGGAPGGMPGGMPPGGAMAA